MTTASRPAFAAAVLIAAVAALGCGSSSEASSDEGELKQCKGAERDSAGKCRINGKFAPDSCCQAAVPEVDLSCDVVEDGTHEFEEGFGSYYAITDEGYSDTDEDAEDISVTTESGGLAMSLGHMSWSPEDGDKVDASRDEDGGFDEYVLHPKDSGETYAVRVFANKLGVVLHKASKNAESDRVGTLDCRSVLDAEPEETDVAKMDSCNVVWVDYSLNSDLFEEGLGSIYDIDDEGNAMTDGDSRGVRLVATSGKREVDIGQVGFSQVGGDKIDVKKSDDFVDYVVVDGSSSEVFTVRIFRAANDAEIPGIGLVLYQKSASADPQQYAVIDCRGIEQPDEI